jgi:outer membrane protein OmpA-like peptidoglycan-associated protein
MNLSRELNTVAKPRIVREMGEWNRKTAKIDVKAESQDQETARVEKISLLAGQEREPMDNELLPPGVKKAAKSSGPAMITFAAGEVTLSDEATGTITNDVVAAMKQAPNSRVQIVAYSTSSDGKESSARRTSLSRALSVRSYLISQGIDATRMDVRAMGVPTAAGAAADKVDMIVVKDKNT